MLGYEVDLWGRLDRQEDAARAILRQSHFSRDAIRLSVVTDVVTTYFNLRGAEQQFRITRRTLESRERSLELERIRYENGETDVLALLHGSLSGNDQQQAREAVHAFNLESEMTTETSVHNLAALVGAEIVGDPDTRIRRVAPLDAADEHALGFCASARYLPQLRGTGAGAVVVRATDLQHCRTTALLVDDPYYAYAVIADHLHPRESEPPVLHPSAVIHETAVLAENVAVGGNAVVEADVELAAGVRLGAGCFVGKGARVGEGTELAAGVVLGAGCSVGARGLVHAGVVIGADGFGFAPGKDGWRKVPQLGRVRIGDDVEIGANSTLDRGALEDTEIGDGVKIDNLVHIAHNVRIGRNTVIAGCTVIAGSTSIGANCLIGGASAIAGHVTLVDGVTLMGMSGVTGDIRKPGAYASPLPAQPVSRWRRNAVRFTQLDELFRRVRSLEAERVDRHAPDPDLRQVPHARE